MKKIITVAAILTMCFTSIFATDIHAQEFSHIDKLFDIRTAITNQGKTLPRDIEKSIGPDLRTLERIFELNTSSLTTIEAYFRIFKIAITTEKETDPDIVGILNEWLNFIKTQCGYDIEYLKEALTETRNKTVLSQISAAKLNSEKLRNIADRGIVENTNNIGK
jgi:hypothetical protein